MYKIILSGHGKEGGIEILKENLMYLAFVNETILKVKTKEEF